MLRDQMGDIEDVGHTRHPWAPQNRLGDTKAEHGPGTRSFSNSL